jgi:(p)ppGpp synthase/HD superfamily hydrolase
MSWSQDQAARALEFAAGAHGNQRVPGKPYSYVVHLASVAVEIMAAIIFSPHLDADLAIQCALLHDVLEDTDTPESVLLAEFGPSVTQGVRALTKNKKFPAAERMRDSLRRILAEPPEIGMVKLADRISNLTEPPAHWLQDKIAAYHKEAVVIHHSLKQCSEFLSVRLMERIEAYKARTGT